MKTFALCTHLTNGVGLQRDYILLRDMLRAMGHVVHGVQFNQPTHCRRADVTIFLEVLSVDQLNYGQQNWLIPNSEWWLPWYNQFLPHFSKILCKTHDCYDIWSKKAGAEKCVYTGFESNDFYRPDVERQRVFLHLAGKSLTKNTEAVMAAWRSYNIPHPLLAVVTKPELADRCRGIQNVTVVDRYSEEEVIEKLNSCMFHLLPSKYEGFGHAIHEAIGVGATVLTLDAPPMNTFNGVARNYLMKPQSSFAQSLAMAHTVDPVEIVRAVCAAASMSDQEFFVGSLFARDAFLTDREFFRKTFSELVNA